MGIQTDLVAPGEGEAEDDEDLHDKLPNRLIPQRLALDERPAVRLYTGSEAQGAVCAGCAVCAGIGGGGGLLVCMALGVRATCGRAARMSGQTKDAMKKLTRMRVSACKSTRWSNPAVSGNGSGAAFATTRHA